MRTVTHKYILNPCKEVAVRPQRKTCWSLLNTSMNHSFSNWLIWQRPALPTQDLLRLLEVSALFDRLGFNQLFYREIQKWLDMYPAQDEQLTPLLKFDFVGYISRSLRNAGFHDYDLDPLVHEIIVKLLVSPGGLFSTTPDQAPFEPRFKASVRNAIINLAQKHRTRQRRIPSVSIHQDDATAPVQIAARSEAPVDQDAVEAFRQLVRKRLGATTLAILDHRLQGGDLRAVVGNEDFGKPSSYRVKTIVQGIKKLAEEFAQERGDEGFLRQVQRAMAGNSEVVQRRVAGNMARRQPISVGSEVGTEEKPVKVR